MHYKQAEALKLDKAEMMSQPSEAAISFIVYNLPRATVVPLYRVEIMSIDEVLVSRFLFCASLLGTRELKDTVFDPESHHIKADAGMGNIPMTCVHHQVGIRSNRPISYQ